jgi:hypothetical protein
VAALLPSVFPMYYKKGHKLSMLECLPLEKVLTNQMMEERQVKPV